MSSYRIVELGPGTVVSCDGTRTRKIGIVVSMRYEMPPDKKPIHVVAWSDGRVTRSNFGLAPTDGSGQYTSSLRVILDAESIFDGRCV